MLTDEYEADYCSSGRMTSLIKKFTLGTGISLENCVISSYILLSLLKQALKLGQTWRFHKHGLRACLVQSHQIGWHTDIKHVLLEVEGRQSNLWLWLWNIIINYHTTQIFSTCKACELFLFLCIVMYAFLILLEAITDSPYCNILY